MKVGERTKTKHMSKHTQIRLKWKRTKLDAPLRVIMPFLSSIIEMHRTPTILVSQAVRTENLLAGGTCRLAARKVKAKKATETPKFASKNSTFSILYIILAHSHMKAPGVLRDRWVYRSFDAEGARIRSKSKSLALMPHVAALPH